MVTSQLTTSDPKLHPVWPSTNSQLTAMKSLSTVYVIESDSYQSNELADLLRDQEIRCMPLASIEQYLHGPYRDRPGCLVVDYHLRDMTALDVQNFQLEVGDTTPLIVLANYLDVASVVEIMQRGAIAVLEQPCSIEALTEAVRDAFAIDREQREFIQRFKDLEEVVSQLSSREQAVLRWVMAGQLNKRIARALEVSVRTIESDRAKLIDKFGVQSSCELVAKFATYTLWTELNARHRSRQRHFVSRSQQPQRDQR